MFKSWIILSITLLSESCAVLDYIRPRSKILYPFNLTIFKKNSDQISTNVDLKPTGFRNLNRNLNPIPFQNEN